MHPVEASSSTALRFLLGAMVASPLLLAVNGELFPLFIVHLTVLVAFGLALAVALLPQVDEPWFPSLTRPRWREFSAAAAIVIIVTGVVGLVTLASSAALRYQPSTQFLQLLSALDIAWATTALMIGVRWLGGRRAGLAAGFGLGVVCVWSIWRYLDHVGFGAQGEWVVRRAELLEFVLPFDTMAAVAAVGSLVFAVRRRHPTAQPSPQS